MHRFLFLLFSALIASAEAPLPTDPFASGDFAGAERLAAKDKSPAGLAALARIRLYQERRAEAKKLAAKALKADPANAIARRVLDTAKLRDVAFNGTGWRIKMPKEGADIAFVATDPLPILKVRVAGTDAYFFLDTGAPDLILDGDFAREVGLAPEGGRANLSAFEIGAVNVANITVALLPTRNLSLKKGIRLDGIVGAGFLAHFLSTLNYPRGELMLRPRAQSKAFERAAKTRGATVVPMWLVGDHFVFARAKLGSGPEGLFNIDTGLADGGVQATKETLDAAGIALDQQPRSGTASTRFIPFKSDAAIGRIVVHDLAGFYTPDGDQYGIFPFKVAGSLSHGTFRNRTLTLDFVAMKLVVE